MPCYCLKPFVKSRALYLGWFEPYTYLYMKTHLHGNGFLSAGSGTSSLVLFTLIESILDFMALCHVLTYGVTIASLYVHDLLVSV